MSSFSPVWVFSTFGLRDITRDTMFQLAKRSWERSHILNEPIIIKFHIKTNYPHATYCRMIISRRYFSNATASRFYANFTDSKCEFIYFYFFDGKFMEIIFLFIFLSLFSIFCGWCLFFFNEPRLLNNQRRRLFSCVCKTKLRH